MKKSATSYSFLIALLGVLLGVLTLLLHVSAVKISNVFFILGLFCILIGCICLVAKGHLFTGWRIFHRKGDNERFENEKIPAKEIGHIKNSKIVVNLPARVTLLIGVIWVVFAIIITV